MHALQRDWNKFMMSHWRTGGARCGLVARGFLDRIGLPCTGNEQDCLTAVRALGLRYVPKPAHWHKPIGGWLFASFPSLPDVIAKTKDATSIDLNALRFAHTKTASTQKHPLGRDISANTRSALHTRKFVQRCNRTGKRAVPHKD